MVGVKEIPGFQLLSRRARMLDLHTINGEIAFLYSLESFMILTCKHSTAARRNARGEITGILRVNGPGPPGGWSYGKKCHMTLDADSLLIVEWLVTKGNIHDSRVSHDMVDSVRNFHYYWRFSL